MSGKSLTFAPVFRNNIKNNYTGMHSKDELKDITHFLLEYAGRLMGSGVHTSRVVRNTHRIGQSLDVEVAVSVIQKRPADAGVVHGNGHHARLPHQF